MMHAVINHLWQSTVFAILAGLLTLAFGRNRAQVRYWLWFSASVKFLAPFALLLSLGGYLGRSPVAKSLPVPAIPYVMVQVAEPFPASASSALPAQTHIDWVPIVLVSLWLCGFLSVTLSRVRAWLRIRAALRSGTPLEISFPVPVLSTTHVLEPGVIGFFRPKLLLPPGIREHLTPEQLQVVLSHELCHVRRRDNLTAAVHMVVEALFWFHPLVWWISARLAEERERACDEEVLQLGNEPEVYAESILKTCKVCVAPPLACAAGVTGSDLNKRIVRIITQRIGRKLNLRKKFLLGAAGFLAIAVPIAFGMARGEPGQANAPQSEKSAIATPNFEVASIKPDKSSSQLVRWMDPPKDGRWYGSSVTLRLLIRAAYGVQKSQVIGGPKWVNTARFDIEAKSDSSVTEELLKLNPDQAKLLKQKMLRALLASRFQLKLHRGTKILPVYALVFAKHGPKLRQLEGANSESNALRHPGDRTRPVMFFTVKGGRDMSGLTQFLSETLGRTVVDKTGLKGNFNFTLPLSPDEMNLIGGDAGSASGVPQTPDASGPSLFTEIQEQLGLKLKPEKGAVEVLIIDHVEKPSAN
jgi:bla regulator protein blaR1